MRKAIRNALAGSLLFAVAGSGCTGGVGDGNGDPPGGMKPPGSMGTGGSGPGAGGSGPGAGGSGSPGTGGTGSPGTGGTGSPPISAEMIPAKPGHTPMRRLTRAQYNNTIENLLGIVGDPAGEFGVDEEDGGFAANSVAPLKDLQLEKYQQAAYALAEKAVANLANLVRCAPGTAEAACADQFIRNFGKRAYRRPLLDAEATRYKAVYEAGRASGDMAGGIALVIAGMLQSPYFLYRIELGDPATATKDGVALTQYELGTRLSYFLTNSTPDEALLAAADTGKLKTPEGISAEAMRLLMGAGGRKTITSFFEQWLQIEDILTVEKDAKAYPAFTPLVRAAMRDEIYEFVDQVTRLGDGKLETLLTTNVSWIRGPLNPIYGLPMAGNAGGSIEKKVTHPAGERAGVFTLAGLQAKHGHADQSSPVGRGFLVSSRVLCVTPPDPPPGVDNNIPAPDPNVSTRVRFEKHREKPECAACHDLMDPFGVTFEIYDGVGHFRTMDGNKTVDAASTIKGTKGSDGPVKNALELMRKLAVAEETKACFAKQMFRYAFGRWESGPGGMPTATDDQTIADGLAALNRTGRIPDLMVAITTSKGFRNRLPVDLQ